MNFKVIARNVGYALLVDALFMLLSALVSLLNGNDGAFTALMISFVITFTVGAFPFIFVRKTSVLGMKEAYVIIVLSWCLSFIFGMLPYALWGGPFTLVNALFESVSGFTTTGATILDDIEALPDSLLFWRSSTHFIGGLGVVVFLLLLIPSSSQMRLRLSNLELSSLSKQTYRTRTNKTVYIFAYVYLGIFVACFLCYLLVGMKPFDAVNHAMTVAATGGFSTKNLSIGAYGSVGVETVTIVFMFIASIHYGMLYIALVTRSLKPLKNEIFKHFVNCILVCFVILAFFLKVMGYEESVWGAVRTSMFQTMSYATSTGLATADNSLWPMAFTAFLLLFGLQCGMAGSTTGGLKADRAILLGQELTFHSMKPLHPASVHEGRINGRVVPQDQVAPHMLYIALFSALVLFSYILGLLFGVDSENAFTASVASLANIGPAAGSMGTFGSYNGISAAAKLLFSFDMFLGRVEIYPILAVCMMLFGSPEFRRQY